jgi:hypothetical protein
MSLNDETPPLGQPSDESSVSTVVDNESSVSTVVDDGGGEIEIDDGEETDEEIEPEIQEDWRRIQDDFGSDIADFGLSIPDYTDNCYRIGLVVGKDLRTDRCCFRIFAPRLWGRPFCTSSIKVPIYLQQPIRLYSS